jgi:hypothetical protein
MTVIPKRRVRWRVTAADGISHAFTNLPTASCGAPNQPERFDYWKTVAHCQRCTEVEVAREEAAS